jgi:hypothetical protein
VAAKGGPEMAKRRLSTAGQRKIRNLYQYQLSTTVADPASPRLVCHVWLRKAVEFIYGLAGFIEKLA